MIARRWPGALVGMIALIGLIEGWLARHDSEYTSQLSFGWRLATESASRDSQGRDVLCFGDSLVKHGVLPAVLRARAGLSAYNLAIPASTAASSYFQLRRALDAGARPRSVVVDFKPGLLAGGPEYQVRAWQETSSLRETVELAVAARSAGFFARVAVGHLLPSARGRLEVRDQIRHALAGETDPTAAGNQILRRHWAVNEGANVAPGNPAFDGRADEATQKRMMSRIWLCHRINARFLERFLALAGAHGIRVDWLLPPQTPEIQAERERSGADARHVAFVRQVQTRHPLVTVVDARRCGYGPGVFIDSIHLDRRGALALSLDLAAVLRAGPRAEGWVALPAYREPPADFPLEDTEGSRLAVSVAAEKQRR